jgi:NAD(P)-dependent dehydrogenase (short-subunit alcohol dehydrogenase family)
MSKAGWARCVHNASKAALCSFASTWANERKDSNVRVNLLSPGVVERNDGSTDFADPAWNDWTAGGSGCRLGPISGRKASAALLRERLRRACRIGRQDQMLGRSMRHVASGNVVQQRRHRETDDP